MDNQIKTSFIPRKAIDVNVNAQQGARIPVKKVGRTIFSLIATLIFLTSIAGAVLVTVWQIKLNANIVNQVNIMKESKKKIDEKFVQEASRLNNRIESSQSMLANHVAPSEIYTLLQDYTLQTVSFSQFSFIDNQDGTIDVRGSGEAKRYESIILQSDAFGKSGYLRNVIFTNLSPGGRNDNIGFSFEATLDPKLIFYKNTLTSSNP
jgi:hypothetical protein